MRHLLLSSGSAGMVSRILLHNRFRKAVTRNILLVNIALLPSLFLNIALYYQSTILEGSVIAMQYDFIPAVLLGAVVYFGMAFTLAELPGAPRQMLILSTLGVIVPMSTTSSGRRRLKAGWSC